MPATDPAQPALPRELEELCASPAFQEARIGMAALAPDFTILRANPALAASLGYEPQEMVRLPPDRFTHPDDAVDFAAHLARIAASGTPLAPYRKRCLTRSGGRLWSELSFAPIRSGAALAGWLCQVRDVSDVQTALDQLERERRLFIAGPVVVFRWANAPGWPVEYVSPNVHEVFGWSAAELTSGMLPYADLVHPDDLARVAAEVTDHVGAGGCTFEQTYRVRHRSGSWRWLRDFTVIHGEPGAVPSHFEGYVFDDTARIEAELLGAAHVKDQGRLLQLSRRALEAKTYQDLAALTRADLQERLGVRHALFYLSDASTPRGSRLVAGAGPIYEEVQQHAAEVAWDQVPVLQEVAAALEPVYCRDLRQDPRGDAELFRRFEVRSLLAAPLFRAGEQIGSLWTGTRADEGLLELSPSDLEYFRNLAGVVALAFERIRSDQEWRAAQARLGQVEKLEAVGQLAGGVAHNFNNALTVILGHASLLLEAAPADSPLRPSLEAILRAGEGSAKAVSQLLQFARSLPEQALERIEPAAMVKEFGKMVRAVLPESVRLVVRADDDLPPIAMEGGAFGMALMNLVLNARDAMRGVGRLGIRASSERRGATRWLRLEVEDDGPGMDAKVKARIFEPFFTTKGEQGTGLGLPAVYGAVTRAGGSIEVRSEPDRGSCFTIRLPESSTPAAAAAPSALPVRGGERRVLVVEDDEAVRSFTARALRSHGYRVETVGQARSALEVLQRSTFELVLADVVMHGMDGFELARRIRALPGGPRVLLMSGYPGEEARGGRPGSGPALLRKPFTAQELAAAVEAALGSPHPGEAVAEHPGA